MHCLCWLDRGNVGSKLTSRLEAYSVAITTRFNGFSDRRDILYIGTDQDWNASSKKRVRNEAPQESEAMKSFRGPLLPLTAGQQGVHMTYEAW